LVVVLVKASGPAFGSVADVADSVGLVVLVGTVAATSVSVMAAPSAAIAFWRTDTMRQRFSR